MSGWLKRVSSRAIASRRWGWSGWLNNLYPSYLKLPLCWLRSLTRITYYSKLIGMRSLAALMQLQLFRVYIWCRFDNPKAKSIEKPCTDPYTAAHIQGVRHLFDLTTRARLPVYKLKAIL
ncbi:hypothetical protein BSR00_09540 [Serratia liquefaciens]|nr:hypothetical protein BSQ35_00940 [Serratia liquefaciens]RYM75257.1 hypothetical protein BSR00_09540 [Serratia liquefaciens]RYM80309.1 hypothetical protein BSR01_08745 [Serratia liquefaciens]